MSTNYFNLNNSLLIDLPPEKCDKKRERNEILGYFRNNYIVQWG